MAKDFSYLMDSVADKYPVIITEFNAHTAADWDQIKSTSDDPFEASRLASQIVNLVTSGSPSIYVFKFSLTPRFVYSFLQLVNVSFIGEYSLFYG